MDVVMDTVEEIQPVAPMSPEQISSQLDRALTELSGNINTEENFNKILEIQGVLEGSDLLDGTGKEMMLNRIADEIKLQQEDCRVFFQEELDKNEHKDNPILEVQRLKNIVNRLERAKATSGVEELRQAYYYKITEYEIQLKVAAIRRYVLEGQGEVGMKSWLDLQRVEAEVIKELDPRKRNAQLARIMALIQSTDGPKQEKTEWVKKLKGKMRKAYEQMVEEWEVKIERLENDPVEGEQMKQDFIMARKALQSDAMLQQFDQATLLAQLDQVILRRNLGDVLIIEAEKETTTVGETLTTSQEEDKGATEEELKEQPLMMEGSEKRKLDDVISAAMSQKAKQEEGMFREQMIPARCRAPTLEEQGIDVDSCAFCAHRRMSENILIIDITEKWTNMDDLIPVLERLIREQMVEIRKEEDTTGWKQTVRESDWKIWRTQSTSCMVIPLAQRYEVNVKTAREGRSILRTEIFSVAKVLNTGIHVPVLCCYLPIGHCYATLVDAMATSAFRGGTNEWEAVCSMTQCIRTEGYRSMDSKALVIPRLINKMFSGSDSGKKRWNKEVIFEIYGDCMVEGLQGEVDIDTVGPYRFMIGERARICDNFTPSPILMESYLCTMLEGVQDDVSISHIMGQIQIDNPGFDYQVELSGVMDGFDRKKGSRRLFLLWHMQTRILTVKKALRALGSGKSAGAKGDIHIRFEVLKDLPGYLDILTNWKASQGLDKTPRDEDEREQVMTSKPYRGKAVKTPDSWEVTPKRHTFKTPESQLGCLAVYEEMFQREATANKEIRDTVAKHLPAVGRAHNILVDRHDGLQQRVERTEAFIMEMLKNQGRDPKEFVDYSAGMYAKQQKRATAVPEFSLPANEKVDMEDMLTMLEKSRKRMKEIDDGKAGDASADY